MTAASARERRWFPTVLVHSLLIQGLTAALRPALAYAVIAAEAPTWMLGVLAASFAVPALLLALPVGRFIDLFGEQRAAVVGALLVTIGVALALLGVHTQTPTLLVVASLLVGSGHMPSIAVGQTQVAHRTAADRLDTVYGYYTFSAACGQLLGPLLLILPGGTSAMPPLTIVLGCCLGLAIGLLAAAFLLTSSHHAVALPAEGGMLRQAAGLIRRRGVLRALIVGAISVAIIDIVQVYWPALGVERGYDVVLVSAMLSLRAIASMASRLALGRLVSRYGRTQVLAAAMLIAATALSATALSIPAVFVVAAAIVFGFSLGVCQPLSMAWLAAITPAHNRGISVTLRLGMNRVAQTVVPATLGGIAALAGVWSVVVGAATLLLIAAMFVGRTTGEGSGNREP